MKDWLPRGIVKDRLVVRPVASGPAVQSETGDVIFASSWNVLKQAAPDTVFLNPTQVEMFCDTNDAYEGSANSTKTIIFFDALPAGGYLFSPWTQNNFEAYVESTGFVLSTLRSRHITAAWSPSAITWNQFIATPPTMDPAVTYETLTKQGTPIATGGKIYFDLAPLSAGKLGGIVYGIVLDIRALVSGLTAISVAKTVPLVNGVRKIAGFKRA